MKKPNNKNFCKIVRAYALKNAIENNGKADKKRVFDSVIGHFKQDYPEFVKELIKDRKELKGG